MRSTDERHREAELSAVTAAELASELVFVLKETNSLELHVNFVFHFSLRNASDVGDQAQVFLAAHEREAEVSLRAHSDLVLDLVEIGMEVLSEVFRRVI